MFRTKKDVDKHVVDTLGKINNENERNLRGYTFARLYFQIKEHEMAKRYLAGFLSVRDSHALGHKLMGQIYEAQSNLERAVQSYKRSIEIDSSQKDIILKICELYCCLPVDHETAKYWADRAEQLFPHHETVFQLRECLVSADGEPDHQGLEKLITNELIARPRDVNLHIKLLKLYIDTERIKEAYSYALKVESKYPYRDNIDWYYCLTEIFEAYQEEMEVQLDNNFYFYLLTTLDHLVGLTLADPVIFFSEKSAPNHGVCNTACTLNIFDQHLQKAWQLSTLHEDSWGYFLHHMRGQLYFRIATLLLKRAKKEQGNWKEACRIAAALFVICYSFKPNSPEQEIWFTLLKDKQTLFNSWYKEGTKRMIIAGYIITTLCKEEKGKWLKKIKQETCIQQVRERIYNRLFNSTKKTDPLLSHFLQDQTFLTCSLEFPEMIALQEYSRAHQFHPESLHHLVWLALHIRKQVGGYNAQTDYKFKIFDGLQFSTSVLTNGTAESLCQLDVDAFLYATVYTSQLEIDHRRAIMHSQIPYAPLSVPPDIADPLCTKEQANWWRAAYKLYTNSVREKLGEMRRILQRGLEVIRGVGNHGMDVKLVVHLARTFADRTSDIHGENDNLNEEEISSLESRASHYWKIALNMLEKLSANQTLKCPKECLFRNYRTDPSSEEISSLKEEGQLFLACRAMKEGQLEDAASTLSKLSSPHASFYLALTLKRLAERRVENKSRREIPSNAWNTHISLLTRARDALYSTLDRIQGDSKHPLNLELQSEIEDVENQLAAADTGVGVRTVINTDGTDEDEDESVLLSRNGSLEEEYREETSLHSTPKKIIPNFLKEKYRGNINSPNIFKKHLPPSPERLDAQIRALALSHDTLVKTLLEQQNQLIETNRAIVDELRQNKTVVEQLKKQLEDIQISFGKEVPVRGRVKSDSLRTEQDDDEEGNGYTDGYWDYFVDGSGAVARAPDVDYRVNYDICQPTTPIVTETTTTPVVNYIPPNAAMTQYRYQYPAPAQDSNRMYFPPVGPGLPFTEGQQLPQFHFHVPQLSNSDAAVSHTSAFTHIPSAAANPCVTQSATVISTSTWSNKQVTTPGVAHPFQIPVPTNALGLTNPPSILSSSSSVMTTTSIQVPPPSNLVSGTQLQTLLGSSTSSYTKPANLSVTLSPGSISGESDQESTSEVIGDFKPVIPLPAEVALQTGEENEKVLFEERAKLFRFVDKEWKERGVGTVKLLHNEALSKVRLLMRRDQVLKVCANHNILPNMELQTMKDNERAWVWAAQDYADEEMKLERFCIRFKTVEIANSFKVAFELAILLASEARLPVTPDKTVTSGPRGDTSTKETTAFGDKFKPKEGSWICTCCLIVNSHNKDKCVACETSRCGSQSQQQSQKTTPELTQFVSSGHIPFANISKPAVQSEENDSLKFGTFVFNDKSQEPNNTGDQNSKPFSLENFDKEKTTTFGGFTFTSTPVIQNSESKEREIKTVTSKSKAASTTSQTNAAIKTSPFAAFSFKQMTPIETIKTTDNKKSVDKIFGSSQSSFSAVQNTSSSKSASDDNSTFGKGSSISNIDFSTISTVENSEKAFQKDPNFKGFRGAGSSLFTQKMKSGENAAEGDTPDEFIPTAEFKPIISLPDLIDVKTGEEEEIKLFGERAKLFRYDSEGRQWKERGVGELKVMYNESTKKYRLLMRREQVFKLCANHYILKWMRLSPLSSSDRAWVWIANDYAEGELKSEKLAVRFKTTEIAQEFKTVFEQCQANLEDETSDSNIDANTSVEEKSETIVDTRPLSEIFKPKPGSWECTACYIKNEQDKLFCIACETPKPDSRRETTPEKDNIKLKFGIPPQLCNENFNFVTAISDSSQQKSVDSEKPTSTAGFIFQNQNNIQSTESVFGKLSNTTTSPTTTTPKSVFKPSVLSSSSNNKSPFIVKTDQETKAFTAQIPVTTSTPVTQQSAFNFSKSQTFQFNPTSASGSLFNIGSSTPTKTKDNVEVGSTPDNIPVHFKFGSPQKYEFSFSGVRPRSPTKTPKSPASLNDSSIDAGEEVESPEADNIYFQPVIPLPPKIEVKTGEENENVHYTQRAKLFRFVSGEWKERGVGDLKILKSSETGLIRLLMRRDQVLKVCMNHYLTSDMNFVPKGDKSFLWSANDFTDGEVHPEQFAIRFKTAEITTQFKEAIDAAQKIIKDFQAKKETIQSTTTVTTISPPAALTTTASTSPVPTTSATKKSALASFSFCLNKETTSPPKFSLSAQFGVTSPTSKNMFGNVSPKVETDSEDVIIIEEKQVSPDKKAEANKLLLPDNFYLYETKDPCPGCRGCEDEEDDIEIVYEKKPTPEQLSRALKYQLPSTFYLYEDKPLCPGCRGCDDDNIPSSDSDISIKKYSQGSVAETASPTKDEISIPSEEKSELLKLSESEDQETEIIKVSDNDITSKAIFGVNKSITELSFENLAAQSSSGFTESSNSTKDGTFAFAGTGMPVFPQTANGKEEDESDQVESNPDIHFQPVVPLPDLIEVKTGEEDESPVFVHRAKFYRYDVATSQWKERGVGDFKILRHKEKCRFRLLLRREQVYKIACNHYIHPDLVVNPLSTSNNAVCWNTVDYADGQPDKGSFAIKFKNQEILDQFKEKLEECKAILKSGKEMPVTQLVPDQEEKKDVVGCTIDKSMLDNIVNKTDTDDHNQNGQASKEINEDRDSGDDDEDDEDDEDDDDDDLIMFEKRITLAVCKIGSKEYETVGTGTLCVMYDDSIFGARVKVHDDSKELQCDHHIAVQTCLRIEKNNAYWSALDMCMEPPEKRHFRATFSSINALQEFHKVFEEGKQMAVESEILEPDDSPLQLKLREST